MRHIMLALFTSENPLIMPLIMLAFSAQAYNYILSAEEQVVLARQLADSRSDSAFCPPS